MGRKTGVTAAQTREQLLASAAKVFAEQGYAGARVSEIARDAGLTTGAIYAHYATKADLLCEAIRCHGAAPLAGLAETGTLDGSVGDTLREIGRLFAHRPDRDGALLMEAAVAARRDREVAKLIRENVTDEEEMIAALLRSAQKSGDIDPTIPPDATARLCMTLAMGSLVVTALGLPPADEADWSSLINRLVAAMES